MPIKLQSITADLQSVLLFSDATKEGVYHNDLESLQSLSENLKWFSDKEQMPRDLRQANQTAIEESFLKIFRPFLKDHGLLSNKAKRPYDIRFYCKEEFAEFYLNCLGIKLLGNRDTCLDGFVPNLVFQINYEKRDSQKVIAQSYLQYAGYLPFQLLANIAAFSCNIVVEQKILLEPRKNQEIAIAPITMINHLVFAAKRLAEFLGEEGIKRINETHRSLPNAPEYLNETAKNYFARLLTDLLGITQ